MAELPPSLPNPAGMANVGMELFRKYILGAFMTCPTVEPLVKTGVLVVVTMLGPPPGI